MDVIHYTHASRSGAAWYVFNLVRAVARREGGMRFVCPADFEYLDRLRKEAGDLRISATIPPFRSGVPVYRKLWQMLTQSVDGLRTARALRRGSRGSTIVHVNFTG